MNHYGDDATTGAGAPVDSVSGNNGKHSKNDLELEQRLERLWQMDTRFSRSNNSAKEQVLHGYVIRKVLGGGAFGIVYLADDLEHDREVALKVPRPEVLLDVENRQRFANEAMLAAKLKHPGIVEVFQTEMTGPTPYIAAAYCQGPDLAQWLADRTEPPSWPESVKLLIQICDAVEYAHQRGVYHRDLKPANIMLTEEDAEAPAETLDHLKPKVTDFGLAKLADPTLTNTRSSLLIGTPMYMAPEQMEPKSEIDKASVDVYALGVILFELLTGHYPVQGSSYFEVLDNIRTMSATRLRAIRNDLPKSLDKVCATCLQSNPQARYSSVAEFSNDLRRCQDGQPVVCKSNGVLARLKFWCTRPKRAVTAGWFMIINRSILAAWGIVSVAFSFAYGVVTWDEYARQAMDVILLILIYILPAVWIGGKIVQGKRWPVWIGVTVSTLNIVLLGLAIVNKPMLFRGLGLDPYFLFTVLAVLLICSLIQLVLLVCVLVGNAQADRISLKQPIANAGADQ